MTKPIQSPTNALAIQLSNQAIAEGKSEAFEMAERILGGENKTRVWREYRKLTATALTPESWLK